MAANSTVNPKGIAGRRKPQVHAIPMSVVLEIGDIMQNGARKYGLFNWRDRPIELQDYIDATFRHFEAICRGEDIDPVVPADPSAPPGSGRRHWAHIAATAMVVMDAMDHGTLIDTRWKPPPAPEIPHVKPQTGGHVSWHHRVLRKFASWAGYNPPVAGR